MLLSTEKPNRVQLRAALFVLLLVMHQSWKHTQRKENTSLCKENSFPLSDTENTTDLNPETNTHTVNTATSKCIP